MARLRNSKKMTPRAMRGWGRTFAVAALLTTAGIWWLAAVYSHQRAELAAFKASPVCGAAAGSSGDSCRLVQAAVVDQSGTRRSGNSGYNWADLSLPDGSLVSTRFQNASAPAAGEAVTLTSWHGKPALIQPARPGSTPIATLTSPQWGVGNDATGILVLMAFILGMGTAAWGLLMYFRISQRRALPVHVVAGALFAVVVVLRLRNDYGALVTAAYVEPPVFLVFVVAWLTSRCAIAVRGL